LGNCGLLTKKQRRRYFSDLPLKGMTESDLRSIHCLLNHNAQVLTLSSSDLATKGIPNWARADDMTNNQLISSRNWVESDLGRHHNLLACTRYLSRVLILAGAALFFYGSAWNYATRRYLEGFADAIVPLNGTPEQKSEALLEWLRHTPGRRGGLADQSSPRDPVGVVQDGRLLKVCGSASNAFINLSEAAGLKTRRLLLLDAFGGSKHVVVEVAWGDRWAVVDPSFRAVFRDRSGRPLTKEELHDPEIFQNAISRIPDYNPEYTFERTVHLHLTRIPLLGTFLRRALDLLFPRWEEMANWGYLPEHPSLWPIVISLPLFLLGIVIGVIAGRYNRNQLDAETGGLRELPVETSRVFLHRSA